MTQSLPNQELVIVKRRSRGRKQMTHTGAWKVAFADFTLAMMALFLVLWLIQLSNQQEKNEIANSLRGDMFDVGSINPFDMEWAPAMIKMDGVVGIKQSVLPATATGTAERGPALHNFIPSGEDNPNAGKGDKLNSMVPGEFETQVQLEFLAKELSNLIQDVALETHVKLIQVPQGIRILVHDNSEREMFVQGSSELTIYFEDLLMALGPVLKNVHNSISISGHTDATQYSGKAFTNWELSSLRALNARRVLEFAGVPRAKIIQVTGMAEQQPFHPESPLAPENRRVELLILTDEAEAQLRALGGYAAGNKIDGDISDAHRAATDNQPRQRYSL